MPVLSPRANLSPAKWSDQVLLRRLLRNEARAWNEFVRRYRALMYRCISKVTCKLAPYLGPADLDEIYAEVMVSLIRNDMHKLRQYDPARGTKLSSWIGLLSINGTYDYLRSVSRVPMLDRIDGIVDLDVECERTPLDELLDKERWEHLKGFLADFSDKDRMFLELYYRQGMDAAAVADEMDISLKTVYSKKHKIRAHLRRCLERTRKDSAIADLLAVAA